MSTEAAKELGRKGGQATSEAKARAARENAKKPRKSKKPIPDFTAEQLLKFAALELKTERDRCAIVGIQYNSLKINGHDLVDVINHYINNQA